jgi:PAS domain S-box-containing protein
MEKRLPNRPYYNTLVTTSRFARAAPWLAGLLYLALYLAWAWFADPPLTEAAWTGSFALLFSGLLVTLLAWQATTACPPGPLRSAWRWMAVGFSLWSAVDLLRLPIALLDAPAGWVAVPGGGLYLLGAVALLAGLMRAPRQARAGIGQVRMLVDSAITSAATITLAWMMLFNPSGAALNTHPAQASALLAPLADLVLLLALLNLFVSTQPGSFPAPLAWLTAGVVGYALSDLAYATPLAPGGFTPASPVNFGWTIGDALFLVAAVVQLRGNSAAAQMPTASLVQRTTARMQSLLPLVLTIVLGWYTLIDMQLQGRNNPLGLWMTVVLSLALIGRQGILTGEIEFQQYASLVNSIAEPAFICNRKGELQLVNPAFLAISGDRQPTDLIRRPLVGLVEADQPVSALLETAAANGWTGEVTLRTRLGRLVPVLLSLRPLSWSRRNTLALAGTAHDLTEVKRQQAELLAAFEQITASHLAQEKLNAELEQRVLEKTADLSQAYEQLERQNMALKNLDQLKSDFVSMVSHELRAPLTNINSGIELVLSRSRTLSPSAQETLGLVQAEIQRLAGFIETILDLSALDAGRMPIYPAPLELAKVVRAIQRQMTHLPGTQRIRWELPPKLPEFIADERAMVSVLFHLLDNALKYAPEGPITVSAGVSGRDGWITVADQGIGIPAEDLPMLFSRFFRSRPSDAQTVYGHGLGLYIVSRLMEAMNGKITVENHPKGGAWFTCWLPLVTEEDTGEEDGLENTGS